MRLPCAFRLILLIALGFSSLLAARNPESGTFRASAPDPLEMRNTLPLPPLYRMLPDRLHKEPPNIRKLIEKADGYFGKMWYAEAAKLYEEALEKSAAPSFDLIRKAADSHYFNTNMERAYFWYDQLFEKYREEMAAEDLFKYEHSLKGTGRYARAKRISRLYNREAETGNLPQDAAQIIPSQEVILDNILKTEQRIQIRNLSVNSEYSDFAPMYHQDELVFASARDTAFLTTHVYKWNNQAFLDLYVGKLNAEGRDVQQAVKFSRKVNSKYHEAGVAFSPDNQRMFFTRNNYRRKLNRDKEGVNNLQIYMSRNDKGRWSEAESLPFNDDAYSTGHPALSPDGKQLYFVSDMPGTLGDTDIFVVDIREDGSFSDPRNLGPEINTPGKEMFPFISEEKLYFASNGHVGLGGLDLFEVNYTEADGFMEVRNMGQPINSNKDDFSLIIREADQSGFFASNREGGKGDDDLYSFQRQMPEEVSKATISGVVTETITGKAIPGALVQLLDENRRKFKEIVAGEDGTFLFEDLEGEIHYLLTAEKEAFLPSEKQVTVAPGKTQEAPITMERLENRILVENGIRKLKSDQIFFDFDRAEIRQDAARELDTILQTLKDYPQMVIRIESHTDARGPALYNKHLSDLRAKASRDYLIGHGISPDRIESAIGYGEEQIRNACDGSVRCTEAKHQQNRRSDFIIVSM